MFCSSCGKEVPAGATACPACGTAVKTIAKRFCQNCGAEAAPAAEVCVKCGVRLAGVPTEGKDWLTALLLAIFVGVFGVHRFYTGHTAIGIVQLLTLGGCGIWVLIDIIMIATGAYKDSAGRPLVKR